MIHTALLVVFVQIPGAVQAQPPTPPLDPMRDVAIWGIGSIGGPAPTPVVESVLTPEEWAIVPSSLRVDAAALVSRWIREPGLPPPTGVDDPDRVDVARARWLRRGSCDPGAVRVAYTSFHVPTPGVWMVRAPGASWVLINGELYAGDPERRNLQGVPVALGSGGNEVFVAANGLEFEFELWAPPVRLLIEPFDIGWPHGDDLTFPIFNASTDLLHMVHVHYGHAVRWNDKCKPGLTDWRDGGYIPPLCMLLGASYYDGLFEDCEVGIGWDARDVFVPLCVYAHEGEVADHRLLRRRPDERGRIPNNFDAVPRSPDVAKGTLLGLYPQGAVHVYGTAGTPEENQASLVAARFDQQLCWYLTGNVPPVVSDEDYMQCIDSTDRRWGWLNSEVGNQPVVLRGNRDTNSAWSAFVPDGSPEDAGRGWALVGGQEFVGPDMAGWHESRITGPKGTRTVVLFDTGLGGTRLASALAIGWRGESRAPALFDWGDAGTGAWHQVTTMR